VRRIVNMTAVTVVEASRSLSAQRRC
jgi:hypothetical protein